MNGMQHRHAIDAVGVTVAYGPRRALDGVDLHVTAGAVFGIVGPNGAGKTTLMETVRGRRPMVSGRVRVLGLDPAVRGLDLRQRLGVQQQMSGVPGRLRVREAYAVISGFYDDPRPREEIFAVLDLERVEVRFVDQLSGGERQRLWLALALAGRPELVLLDELTTGLDPEARRRVWSLVRAQRAEGSTVVLTTHSLDEAEAVCDQVLVLHGGRAVASGSPRDLVSDVGTWVLDCADRPIAPAGARVFPAGSAWVIAADTREPLDALVRSGSSSTRPRPARLEDAYFALTSEVAA